MLELGIQQTGGPRSILLLGAHCDDLEIGCGGTILQLAAKWPDAKFVWVTFSSGEDRAAETRNAAARLLAGVRNAVVDVRDFRGSYFPHEGEKIKDFFETLKALQPELIFTHYRNDLHQDHRVINELTWNTFRNHLIMEYEIPKFDGDLGVPNSFVPLTKAALDRKVDVLMECFPSQLHRAWFTRSTFEALARLRGVECNAPEGYAEAYYGRKMRFSL
ncbi:MAG: PIG-L family deacetylase [Betaproteobacteria bacterium]|nr:PIG-L family deacetylase [Betaproteobacteria bacterium]